MPSIIESLQNAVNRLDAAVVAVLGLRSEMATIRDDASSRTTTIINTFLNRPQLARMFVDPINGIDTNTGATKVTALKTIDAALQQRPRDGFVEIILLGNATISQLNSVYSPTSIIGAVADGSANGYSFSQRIVTFLGEATNSPIQGQRVASGVRLYAPYLRFENCDLMVGDSAAEINDSAHIITINATVMIATGSISAPRSAAVNKLIRGVPASRNSLWISGALGTNGAGHVFDAVASGANPNNNPLYASNLTSA